MRARAGAVSRPSTAAGGDVRGLDTGAARCLARRPRVFEDERDRLVRVFHAGRFRELHDQAPPHDHARLGYAIAEPDGLTATALYLPRGIAHGLPVVSDRATLHDQTTHAHEPAADLGVRYDSAGIQRPTEPSPIVSARDRRHPTWDEYAAVPRFDR